MNTINWRKIPQQYLDQVTLLFIAKNAHARWDNIQNSHQKYHLDLKDTLYQLGFSLNSVSSLSDILVRPKEDYIYGVHSHEWFNGKETFTSVLAEYFEIPYLGPKPTVRSVSEDKILTKSLAKAIGIPVADYVSIRNKHIPEDISLLSKPWLLKPRNGIASSHLYYCRDIIALTESINMIPNDLWEKTEFILEEFIDGINVTVPIIENIDNSLLSPFQEFDDNPYNILTHEGKRRLRPGYRREVYEGRNIKEIRQYTSAIEKLINPYDYGRLEFRFNPSNNKMYFIEMNLICNMSRTSSIAEAAYNAEVDYETLLEHVISCSMSRQKITNCQ